ncbi:MAG: hypothetical protein HPY66_0605 [Firmicutes bacterium]|nr:hypothetical protein [Bacillota bacterium]
MGNSDFTAEVQRILSAADLPDGRRIVAEGKAMAAELQIGRTLFFDKYGVSSEYEYKQKMKREGRIMYHAHIGLDHWEETVDALHKLYDAIDGAGYRIDRYGLCLERGMSLPEELRGQIARETGPRLENDEQWTQLGQLVPIQPHTGDFMIGFPASVENTLLALKAGVTTIGNLSQYFAHEAPMWKDDEYTTMATVKAMGIMAGKKDEGTIVHSYLDDGLASLFNDYASIAGWAILERYIVEDLIGARLGHCFGGVTTRPQVRAAWVFALNDIFDNDCCGTMFYGDTISSGPDVNHNRTIAAQYLLWDIMAQLKCPTGHAIMPPPFSEGIRIPNVDEIIEVQLFAREMEKAARRLVNYVDFTECYQIKDRIVGGGRRFAKAVLAGLAEAGVDTGDPVQMLYVLKKLGARRLENTFSVGSEDPAAPGGHRPVYQTDVFRHTNDITDMWLFDLHQRGLQPVDKPVTALLAATDVHEHALFIMRSIFKEFGINVVYLGVEQNPDDIAEAAVANKVDAIAVSTHNGGALEFAIQLKKELDRVGCTAQIFMGGKLNQGREGEELPVDVTDEITALGINTNQDFLEIIKQMGNKN